MRNVMGGLMAVLVGLGWIGSIRAEGPQEKEGRGILPPVVEVQDLPPVERIEPGAEDKPVVDTRERAEIEQTIEEEELSEAELEAREDVELARARLELARARFGVADRRAGIVESPMERLEAELARAEARVGLVEAEVMLARAERRLSRAEEEADVEVEIDLGKLEPTLDRVVGLIGRILNEARSKLDEDEVDLPAVEETENEDMDEQEGPAEKGDEERESEEADEPPPVEPAS